MNSKLTYGIIALLAGFMLIGTYTGLITVSRYDVSINERDDTLGITTSGRAEGDFDILGNGELHYNLIYTPDSGPQTFQEDSYKFEEDDIEEYPTAIAYIVLVSWALALILSVLGVAGMDNKFIVVGSLVANIISLIGMIQFLFTIDSAFLPGLSGNFEAKTFQVLILILLSGVNTGLTLVEFRTVKE